MGKKLNDMSEILQEHDVCQSYETLVESIYQSRITLNELVSADLTLHPPIIIYIMRDVRGCVKSLMPYLEQLSAHMEDAYE